MRHTEDLMRLRRVLINLAVDVAVAALIALMLAASSWLYIHTASHPV